jgi:plastocyanin
MTRIIIFVILLFLSLLLPNLSLAHSEVQVIEMTPDGFSPSEITIDVNSSVIFINKDKESRWPASNVHPTHDIYPEFDPKKPILPGESWAFKPKKAGEWKFHDHLLPHMRGVITVINEKGFYSKEQDMTTKPALNIFVIKFKDAMGNLFAKLKWSLCILVLG